jgi:hypothetical protein
MWSDNETTVDLLGFKVHADLIRSVVTDLSILPVVLGVFGDWGGGKSSIMRMLERDLGAAEYQDVACLYFNGWMFEGYEDAKSALLSSILIQLGENKRFGPKIKARIAGLLKRVKLMELAKLGITHIATPLALAASTSGFSSLPALAAALAIPLLAPSSSEKDQTPEPHDEDEKINWLDLVRSDPDKPDLLQIRKFRDDFDTMLAETSIKSLVILIDDLDRCLPERIIETLEAIKLFVAVQKTAFVIGADPRIIRHAIATRYVKRQMGRDDSTAQEEYDLVQDYLEKLIQIPYHLPRLSPAEIETYVNLLACQKHLDPEHCTSVLTHWETRRKNNFYAAYQHGAIREALGVRAVPEELERRLAWSNSIALVLTEGLKGNPRQVKRMLNAMLLRQQLARVAGIIIRDEVLAKLMVLEYTNLQRFQELNKWQTAENGYPKNLGILENWTLKEETASGDLPEANLGDWNTPSLRTWLRIPPKLGSIDLRDYFWLARDRTNSTLSSVTMVSPMVRRLFDHLIGENEGEQHAATRTALGLDESERSALLQLLQQQVERHPDQLAGPAALMLLAEQNLEGAADTLFTSVINANTTQLDPGVAFRIQTLGRGKPPLLAKSNQALEFLATKLGTKVGRAAANALKK